ncbi:hypothetical protein U1Q18_022660 [Sarracenia purpurea var. burkii]
MASRRRSAHHPSPPPTVSTSMAPSHPCSEHHTHCVNVHRPPQRLRTTQHARHAPPSPVNPFLSLSFAE